MRIVPEEMPVNHGESLSCERRPLGREGKIGGDSGDRGELELLLLPGLCIVDTVMF